MAEFITNTKHVEPDPIVKTTLRRVTYNPSTFSSSNFTPMSKKAENAQNIYLKDIYTKFNQVEKERIRNLAMEEAN